MLKVVEKENNPERINCYYCGVSVSKKSVMKLERNLPALAVVVGIPLLLSGSGYTVTLWQNRFHCAEENPKVGT